MSTPDKLDRLLQDALSPAQEAAPSALALERTRMVLLRGKPLSDHRLERRLALSGILIALIELITLLLAAAISPPVTLLGVAALCLGLFEAVCLLACSIGSRVAIRHLQYD